MILIIRGHKVILDKDLAVLYGVETKYLNRQVKRNAGRFPANFMFRLAPEEKNELVTKWHRFTSLKHSQTLPNAFTEHGVAMLASVLKSERAVRISIHIINTFIRLRHELAIHRELAGRLDELEAKIEKHDEKILAIFDAIRQLMSPDVRPVRRIGFDTMRRRNAP